jgi:hypothetical protein
MEAIQKFKAKWNADVIYLRWKRVYEDAVMRAIFGGYFTYYLDKLLDYLCEKNKWRVWMRGRFFLFCRKWIPRLEVDSEVDKEAMKWDWEDWGFPPEDFETVWNWIMKIKEESRTRRWLDFTRNLLLFGSVRKAETVGMEVMI